MHTIRVPVFQSSSFRRDLGEQLTKAVVKEIEKRTPYKVVRDARRRHRPYRPHHQRKQAPAERLINGDSRELELDLVVNVRWVTSRGEVICKSPPLKIAADAVNVNAASHLVPEYGQSTATAQMQAIQTLAERIVNLMEAPW